MDERKMVKMDFSADFVNENIGLYPLMGGTHYGSSANEGFGGIVKEAVSGDKYVVSAVPGSFLPQDDPPRRRVGRMAVKRLISNEPISEFQLSASVLDRAGVGFDIKSEKTHMFVELTSDGYINAVLEERYFVFDARLPEGKTPRRLDNVTLSLEINAPTVNVSVISIGKEKKVCALRLDALRDVEDCAVCLAAALECPAVCEISDVKCK